MIPCFPRLMHLLGEGNIQIFKNYFRLLEIIEVIISPMPNPASIEPTKAIAGEDCRKKNPTPTPNRTPPPIAHVLLSSLLFVIIEILNYKLVNFLNLATAPGREFLTPVADFLFNKPLQNWLLA